MKGWRRWCLLFACALLFAGCASDGDLCRKTFTPYPDLITGRLVTSKEAPFLRGMEAYRTGDHASAAGYLEAYLQQPNPNKAAHLYLANCFLALGRPFDAELQIDHLENSNLKGFEDQCEWYTVVSWLCSDQRERALNGARAITTRRHTYEHEARELITALEEQP